MSVHHLYCRIVVHLYFVSFDIIAMELDTGMFTVAQTLGSVLCCKCGISMQPNAANMCVKCLQTEIDITEGLQRNVTIVHCPECDKYLQPPKKWFKAELESKKLLTFCVKRVKNLNKVRLVNAEFIWTEPHSKRIKVKLRVRKEVLNGAVLEQSFTVEYVVQDQMCETCSRAQANPDQWVAAVQLRQHVSHRRTFFYLEQIILKQDAAKAAIRVRQMDQGIDFFFNNRSHALKFVEFLGKFVPIKSRSDKQLISHDQKSNSYNYNYTFSVEISPICREDLICLPPRVAASLGNPGPLVICNKVSSSIALLDPFTLRQSYLDADQYFRSNFKALMSARQLVEYIVLDIEPISSSEVTIGGSKYVLADAQVARVSDFGKNDMIFNVKTHLGHILNAGDYALGYDLCSANSNDIELDKYKGLVLPEVILIKKSYEEKRQKKKGKPRSWKLKSLNMDVDIAPKGGNNEKISSEYEQFLRDLEENPDLRFNLSLYRNQEYQPSDLASVIDDGEELPSIPIDELLADLDISDDDDDDETIDLDSMRG